MKTVPMDIAVLTTFADPFVPAMLAAWRMRDVLEDCVSRFAVWTISVDLDTFVKDRFVCKDAEVITNVQRIRLVSIVSVEMLVRILFAELAHLVKWLIIRPNVAVHLERLEMLWRVVLHHLLVALEASAQVEEDVRVDTALKLVITRILVDVVRHVGQENVEINVSRMTCALKINFVSRACVFRDVDKTQIVIKTQLVSMEYVRILVVKHLVEKMRFAECLNIDQFVSVQMAIKENQARNANKLNVIGMMIAIPSRCVFREVVKIRVCNQELVEQTHSVGLSIEGLSVLVLLVMLEIRDKNVLLTRMNV